MQSGTAKKKLTKEERERLKQMEQERRLREAEEARLRAEAEEAARLKRLEEERAARRAAALKQQEERRVQLIQTLEVTSKLDETMEAARDKMIEDEEWDRLMRCDGLPNPKSVPEMNRYVSLWRADAKSTTLEGALKKTDEVIHVISELETVMEETRKAAPKQLDAWKEEQREKLNQATYWQLLDLRPYIDLETMVYSFFKSSNLVSLALWCNTNRSPKNNFHEVKELGFTFTLPADLVEEDCVVRVMRTEYDHFSKFARTFNTPKVPDSPNEENLLTAVPKGAPLEEEEEEAEEDSKKATKEKKEENEEKGEIKDDKKGAPPPPPTKKKPPHYTETLPGELNLRRYRIQGGVYTVDLLKVPPQPRVIGNCTITQVEKESTVNQVMWKAQYNPPKPSEAGAQRRRDPEEVEQEMRQLEKELQKLILITVKLPDSAFWFEPPQMVMWDHSRGIWCSDYFQDVKYNEDQCILQVRTTHLGVMGLAMNRFANLPFQNWEMKPIGHNLVSLTLYAAVVTAEFTIAEGQLCLSQLQDGTKSVLSHLYSNFMKVNTLIQTLQFYGINLFPDRDSYCYIDGLPLKHRPTEHHLYRCMALVSPSVNLAWSRWNLLAGEKNLVFQMKTQVDAANDDSQTQPLVLVSTYRAAVLECTEMSQAFSPVEKDPSKYFADLYQLAIDEIGCHVVENSKESSPIFIQTVSQVLKAASILSYC